MSNFVLYIKNGRSTQHQHHYVIYLTSINPSDSKGNYSATSNNMNLGTLAVDGWAVTFGTARMGMGGLQPRPVPSSLYQM